MQHLPKNVGGVICLLYSHYFVVEYNLKLLVLILVINNYLFVDYSTHYVL